jgi:hypothetical protein
MSSFVDGFVFETAAGQSALEAVASWPCPISNGLQARDVFEHLARSGPRFRHGK